MTAPHLTPPVEHRLTTARLLLRAFEPADAGALYATIEASRAHIARWLTWTPQHASVEDSRAVIQRLIAQWDQGVCTYGVFARESGELLGGLGLHLREADVPSYEIGYWLAAPAEGHGYITEATTALVEYVFGELGARRIEIRCNALNTRSAAVARRLGFTEEGLLRHDLRAPDGSLRDTLIFARIK